MVATGSCQVLVHSNSTLAIDGSLPYLLFVQKWQRTASDMHHPGGCGYWTCTSAWCSSNDCCCPARHIAPAITASNDFAVGDRLWLLEELAAYSHAKPGQQPQAGQSASSPIMRAPLSSCHRFVPRSLFEPTGAHQQHMPPQSPAFHTITWAALQQRSPCSALLGESVQHLQLNSQQHQDCTVNCP